MADQGGAIYLNGLSKLFVYKSTFKNNYSQQNGGAVYLSGCEDIEFSDCTFENNYADMYGSEIYSFYTKKNITIYSSSFHNVSNASAIYCDSTSL